MLYSQFTFPHFRVRRAHVYVCVNVCMLAVHTHFYIEYIDMVFRFVNIRIFNVFSLCMSMASARGGY